MELQSNGASCENPRIFSLSRPLRADAALRGDPLPHHGVSISQMTVEVVASGLLWITVLSGRLRQLASVWRQLPLAVNDKASREAARASINSLCCRCMALDCDLKKKKNNPLLPEENCHCYSSSEARCKMYSSVMSPWISGALKRLRHFTRVRIFYTPPRNPTLSFSFCKTKRDCRSNDSFGYYKICEWNWLQHWLLWVVGLIYISEINSATEMICRGCTGWLKTREISCL